jgi:DNA-directed RNA polymerase subunit RPC12/RpoP
MASTIITCPECKKKFKGKEDLLGKKIRCPFCKEPFIVEDEEATIPPGGGSAKSASKKGDGKSPPPPVPASATRGGADDEEEGSNPYGITHLDLAPRCPNCANEMESEEAVVCLFCGYNTLTRAWGKTAKVVELTFRDYFKHLLPGLLAVVLIVLLIAGVVYYCLVLPGMKKWGWLDMITDHESTRLWIAAIVLGMIWGFGYFAFTRLVLNTKPPDKLKG